MMTGKRIIIAGVILLVVVVCLSGCIKPPADNPNTATVSGNGGTTGPKGGGAKVTPTPTKGSGGAGQAATATPTPGDAGYLTPATPFPTVPTPPSNVSGTRLFDEKPVPTEYIAIYYGSQAFKNNKTAFSYDLYRPPLVIEMCFSPNMTSRTIWYESKYGDHDEKTETVTSISPYAWFKVTIRDPVTGQVIAEEGYSKEYSVEPGKDLVIRSPGTYLIEFSGNELSAQIQMRVPKDNSTPGVPVRKMSCII